MAAVDEPQQTRDFFLPHLLWLVYCGSYIWRAAVEDSNSSFLLYCSNSSTAALQYMSRSRRGKEEFELSTAAPHLLRHLRGRRGVPQFVSFYTVPIKIYRSSGSIEKRKQFFLTGGAMVKWSAKKLGVLEIQGSNPSINNNYIICLNYSLGAFVVTLNQNHWIVH